MIHPKIWILSSLTHSPVVINQYGFLFVENFKLTMTSNVWSKRYISQNIFVYALQKKVSQTDLKQLAQNVSLFTLTRNRLKVICWYSALLQKIWNLILNHAQIQKRWINAAQHWNWLNIQDGEWDQNFTLQFQFVTQSYHAAWKFGKQPKSHTKFIYSLFMVFLELDRSFCIVWKFLQILLKCSMGKKGSANGFGITCKTVNETLHYK